jgi:hypothetical protein
MASKEEDGTPAESGVSSVADKEIEIHNTTLQEKDEIIEDDANYATGLRLGLIVIGLTLSVLLVALVSFCSVLLTYRVLIKASGQCHFSDRNSNHHHCFQFYPRCGMVWKRIPHHHLCPAAHFRKTLPALLIEMDLSELPHLI